MNIFKKILRQLVPDPDEGLFRHIPLSLSGKLYVSPMPYGAYDPRNQVFKIYKRNRINHVFVLVTDKELEEKCRRNLLNKYDTAGIAYSRFVLKDWMAPSMDSIFEMVSTAKSILSKPCRLAVHCHAGVGRTAIAVCCIAISIEGWTAEEAVANVCQFMTINITDEQRRFIKKYEQRINSAE
ncbi:MAG: dual specificity protein phosphatase family protein [Deltaproteobacteria bacterium]|nr:dual specificity protein phosphatase family protein [Deltaproteobacteria bacterium]MBN2671600.1 dual specificity protein phosphatase family protein [Deltaproteobacteria bacterium]